MKRLIFFLSLFFFVFSFKIALSAPPPPPVGASCGSSVSWKEYQASSAGCGDNSLWERECRWVCANCERHCEEDEKGNEVCEERCLRWEKHCGVPQKVAICNPWQKPKRKWALVTDWDEEVIYCQADKDCFKKEIKVKEFWDGRGWVDPDKIHLPVKFYFEIGSPVDDGIPNGWGLICGPTGIEVETKEFKRFLKIEENFSTPTTSLNYFPKQFNLDDKGNLDLCQSSDKDILEFYWNKVFETYLKQGTFSDIDFDNLADFLIQFTNDQSLKFKDGNLKVKGENIQRKEYKIETFEESKILSHRTYEKLKRAVEDWKEYTTNWKKYATTIEEFKTFYDGVEIERKKQIEYFIHFLELLQTPGYYDIQRYYQCNEYPETREIYNKAFCGYFGGRNPKIGVFPFSKPIIITRNIYSPSQDRKVGPCTIREGAKNVVKIRFCGVNGCGPEDAEGVPFTTVNAPEPIGILAFSATTTAAGNIFWITKKEGQNKVEYFQATTSRWIDTDWNGDDFIHLPPGEGDFVDFQFCGQRIEPEKSPFKFRALYRGKKLILDPNDNCQKAPELVVEEETKPDLCIKDEGNIPGPAEKCPCASCWYVDLANRFPETCGYLCRRYCNKALSQVKWVKDLDICHPFQNPEILRVEQDEVKEILEKNHLDEEPQDCTSSYPFATFWYVFFGEKEKIQIDWANDPYYGILEIPYPKDLWKWDLHGLVQYFPATPIVNIWQVQKEGSQYWSQKWHFRLSTKVPMFSKKGEVVTLGGLATFLFPMTDQNFKEQVAFIPTFKPDHFKLPKKVPIMNLDSNIKATHPEAIDPYFARKGIQPEEAIGINRLQTIQFLAIPRSLSYRREIYSLFPSTKFSLGFSSVSPTSKLASSLSLGQLAFLIFPIPLPFEQIVFFPEPVSLPIFYNHLRFKKAPGLYETQLKKLNIWEIWNCMYDSTVNNPQLPTRFEQQDKLLQWLGVPSRKKYLTNYPHTLSLAKLPWFYELDIAACQDEWGEICNLETGFLLTTPGIPPRELSPGKSEFIQSSKVPKDVAVIPRHFQIEPTPGSASYILEIVKGKLEGKQPFWWDNAKRIVCNNNLNSCQKNATCTDPVAKKSTQCTEEEDYCPPYQYCWVDLNEDGYYTWRVRSCADTCNKVEDINNCQCGRPSPQFTFYGCTLRPPAQPISPQIAESFLPGTSILLKWDQIKCDDVPVFYHLKVNYQRSPNEKREACKELEKNGLVNSFLGNNLYGISPECLGTYYWQIRGCLTADCSEEAGPWSMIWYFSVVGEIPKGGGTFTPVGTCKKIVPDCPAQGCGIAEIPKLIFNILNCLLWTGIPVLIIIGIAGTGLTLVFLAGNVELMERIKAIWKGIGIGSLIMLFGWTFLNLIFKILGWRKEFFGDWFAPF